MMRAVGLPKLKACVQCGECMVGSQGDMMCSVSLRTGRVTSEAKHAVGAAKKAVNCVSSLDASLVLAGMADGGLALWEAADGSCSLRERQVIDDGAVRFAVAISAEQCCLVIKLPRSNGKKKKKKSFEVMIWSLEEKRVTARQRLAEGELPVGLGYANSALLLATSSTLTVYSIGGLECVRSTKKFRSSVTKLATCKTGTVATGHFDGSILIWSSEHLRKDGSDLGVATTRLHWHASKVLALCFGGAAGNEELLYSGGDEGVLVVWSLAQEEADDQRDFLPRLGAPIETLAAAELDSEQLVLAVTADCGICCVAVSGGGLRELWRLNGCCLTIVPPKPKEWTVRLVSTEYNRLLLNARSGRLDIYEPARDEVLGSIDVVPHNRVRSVVEIARQPAVLFAAARRGLLVTLDAWLPGGEHNPELKFWTGSEQEPTVRSLEAMVRSPHGDHVGVTALALHPEVVLAVTAGIDGSVRVWTRIKSIPRGAELTFRWTCTAALSPISPVSGIAFNRNGTSLALARPGRSIDLLAPDDLALIMTLSDDCFDTAEHRLVTIFDQCEAPTAILVDSKGFSLWTIESGVQRQKAKWRCSAPVLAAAASNQSYQFALAVSGTKERPSAIFVFTHNEPVPAKVFDLSAHISPKAIAFLSDDTLVLLQPKHILHIMIAEGAEATPLLEDVQKQTSSAVSSRKKRARTFDFFIHETSQNKGPRLDHQTKLIDLNPRPLWTIDLDHEPDIAASFDGYLAAHLRPTEFN